MSDDEDGLYTVLEDQTVEVPASEPTPEPSPELEPVQQVPIAAAPPEPEPSKQEPDEDDLEAEAVLDRLTNKHMVPLKYAQIQREKARTLKAERETISAKVAELEVKAARTAELETAIQQWQTYAQQMAQRQPGQPQPDPQVAEQQKQARLGRAERIAKRFDLYRPDGTLDVDRGLEHLTEQEELAREQAAEMVQPLRRETAQSKSHANRAALAAHLQKQGTPVDATLFNQLWSHLTPELTANQEVAAVAAAAALGWPLLFGTQAPAAVQQAVAAAVQPPARPSPVVVTEPVSQRVVGAPRLIGSAAKAAKELGLTAEQVEKRYGNAGAPWTVLADDTEGNQ